MHTSHHYPFPNCVPCTPRSNHTNLNWQKYKLILIILDVDRHRLFKHVCIKKYEIDKRYFFKLLFVNQTGDAINLGNILHHKSVKSKIPPYFKSLLSICSFNLVYLYHTYCNKNIELQERIAGFQHWRVLSLNLLIASVQVPNAYIILLVTL